jgi:broad specificity phosphatase PhoE
VAASLAGVARALLLRHAQSVWNAERRWQGLADFGLSADGDEQARLAGRALAGAGIASVVSSPFGRARRTAELIASELGLDPGAIGLDDDLRERDVGEWSGLTTDEIEARWPGQIDAWREGRLEQPPSGEGEIRPRVMAAMDRVMAAHRIAGNLLVVTHGGVISAVERALGVEPCRARNCCGRWIRSHHGVLVAEDAVVLADPEAEAETTAL